MNAPTATTFLGFDGATWVVCDMGCVRHLTCGSWCTLDVKSESSQAAVWSKLLASIASLEFALFPTTGRASAIAMHVSCGCARTPCCHNGCLRCTAMLVFCAADGNGKCRNSAKEVSPGMPCIGLPAPACCLHRTHGPFNSMRRSGCDSWSAPRGKRRHVRRGNGKDELLPSSRWKT